MENNQNNSEKSWPWVLLLIGLIFAFSVYFGLISSGSNNNSKYWEIRITHSPDGYEIHKYDYDDLYNALDEIAPTDGVGHTYLLD